MAAAGTLALACGCSAAAGSSPAAADLAACQHHYASACFTPQQLRVAYGIQPLLDRGTNGRGQTVVLMEFANTAQQPGPQVTDIRRDLALFDGAFGLPVARLEVDSSLAKGASPWQAGLEEVEDAEVAHAVAPEAAIRVILIPAWSGPGSWIAAVDGVLRLALSQGSVISLSAILGEECFTPAEADGLNLVLQADREHHVTVVASSGRALELNTRRLWPWVPQWWSEEGGRAITFGSDAHVPQELAAFFPEAVAMAMAYGFHPGPRPEDFWTR